MEPIIIIVGLVLVLFSVSSSVNGPLQYTGTRLVTARLMKLGPVHLYWMQARQTFINRIIHSLLHNVKKRVLSREK